jgi:hypothetical protein
VKVWRKENFLRHVKIWPPSRRIMKRYESIGVIKEEQNEFKYIFSKI